MYTFSTQRDEQKYHSWTYTTL